MSATAKHHTALIYIMVTMSVVDRSMTDVELARIGNLVRQLPVFEDFDEDQFLAVVRDLAGLRLSRSGRREIRDFWQRFGPLPEDLTRIGTEHAVRMHGRGRHPRVYLHAIQVLVLAHWRNKDNDDKETSR